MQLSFRTYTLLNKLKLAMSCRVCLLLHSADGGCSVTWHLHPVFQKVLACAPVKVCGNIGALIITYTVLGGSLLELYYHVSPKTLF